MTTPDHTDPFAGGESTPALSFNGDPVGTVKTITVTEPAKLVQSRDFTTGSLATWPDGNPKMAAVVNGTTVGGDEVSVWASKPSSLFAAIKEAQLALGRPMKAGDKLTIKFDSEEPAKQRGFNPRKIYKAKIEAAPEVDTFSDEPPF